ncbi:MAG TPA: bifunctional YncE family protein/alkaline phosphatase family protein [Bryobacteraceae bacterium]|nr:bifunctional YncE family protein/alkaline phosphatase family protein [Bryobacteraceae bacterium]
MEKVLSLGAQIKIPARAGGVNNGGLALSTDQNSLYVVLNIANTIGVIDLRTNTFMRSIAVGNAPKSITIVGNLAYVTNQGGRPARPGEFTDLSVGTAVAADRESAASVTGTVSVVNLSTQAVIRNIPVGLQPTAILASGGYVFVANSNSDSVSVIDSKMNALIEALHIQAFLNAPFGSSPNWLAMTSRNDLVVTLGANNAAAFYRWTDRRLKFEGFVPTAWYPASAAIAAALTAKQTGASQPERTIVANTKGTAVGSSVPNERIPSGKNTHTFVGSVSIIPVPTTAKFYEYDAQVAVNNGWKEHGGSEHTPLPFRDHRLIQHVFYVIKENRTYNQILGDDPRGNGDPNLVQFGSRVTPNQHALADNFVLFDNFYDSGVLSADGHQHRLTVRIYGEFAFRFNRPAREFGNWTSWYGDSLILEGKKAGQLHVPLGRFKVSPDVPSFEEHLNPDFPNFNTGIPDQYRSDVFLRDFQSYVKNGNLPDLIVMTLRTDHTSRTSAGYPTPASQIADNDLAVGRLVDAISHSPYWANSAIFFVEDDPQSGTDHVDGHRSTAFIASPYIRRTQVNHT